MDQTMMGKTCIDKHHKEYVDCSVNSHKDTFSTHESRDMHVHYNIFHFPCMQIFPSPLMHMNSYHSLLKHRCYSGKTLKILTIQERRLDLRTRHKQMMTGKDSMKDSIKAQMKENEMMMVSGKQYRHSMDLMKLKVFY